MSDITLELDYSVANGDTGDNLDGPWELEGLAELGAVMVEVVQAHGPGGGNPVVRASGSVGAVLAWLLEEYTSGDMDAALDLLRPGTGSARVDG
jgi:hypothetical protein